MSHDLSDALLPERHRSKADMNALDQLPVMGPSESAQERFVVRAGAPLLTADWSDALFLHYEIDARELQPFVPFELDLWHGRAFISLVAFTMRRMRFARGGRLGAWICQPIATHEFLNFRAYVRHGDDAGICFLSEWLPNRLSVLCGPLVYGLPYRHATIQYRRDGEELRGSVNTRRGSLHYEGILCGDVFAECDEGSLDEFLLERYTAFNAGHFTPSQHKVTRRLFRVWHPPWPQVRADIGLSDDTLLRNFAPWWERAEPIGANYSPGARGVWMSAPRYCE